MFLNYIKTMFRNFLRYQAYSILNVTGLAVGIASCMLIMFFINDELSYDRFHEHSDRIVRALHQVKSPDREGAWACIPPGVAPLIKQDYEEVEHYCRLYPALTKVVFKYQETQLSEDRFLFADSTLLKVFTIPLRSGNPETALNEPNSIIISVAMAERLFGSEEPLQKEITSNNTTTYVVTGVYENLPDNSHFHSDAFVSIATLRPRMGEYLNDAVMFHNFYTYLLLREGVDRAEFQTKLLEFVDRYWSAEDDAETAEAQNVEHWIELQPIADIHLRSHHEKELEPNSDINYIYIFSLTALFVLLVACLNFINLSTARSIVRAKEISIRKVLGAERRALIWQFIGEAIQISMIAAVFSVLLVGLALPYFNEIAQKNFSLDLLQQPQIWGLLIALAVLVGFISGTYPAFVLSSFQPMRVLNLALSSRRRKKLRQILVTVQFTISIVLITATILVKHQLDYMSNTRLGWNKEELLVVPLQDRDLIERLETFKTELLNLDGVKSVGASMGVPGVRFEYWGFVAGDDSLQNAQTMRMISTDHDFLKTLEVEFVAGRNFSSEIATDATEAFVINEAGARLFGLEDPVNTPFTWGNPQPKVGRIIGVVRDFHFASLKTEIEPLVIQVVPNRIRYLVVRLESSDLSATISGVERKWREFSPGFPFQYTFLDDDFARLYAGEMRLGKIFAIFSFLGTFLACLGLVGLATYSTAQRTKEIGIRRVVGASVTGVVRLFVNEILGLVAIAMVIAWSVAYFSMQRWMEEFAYRAELGFSPFLISGLLALFIALLSVGILATRAALTNPVESLRSE